MKKSLKLKLLFDLVLTVVMIVLMIYTLTGDFWHEVLGIAIFLMFFVHVAVNYKWIVAVTKKLFNGKFTLSKLKYILNFLLFIAVIITAVSGILIAKEILTIFNTDNFPLWIFIHALSAYISLAIISIHIGLHWKMIVELTKRFLGIKEVKSTRSVICKLFSVAIILMGLKSSSDFELPEYSPDNDNDDSSYSLNIADDKSTTVTAMSQSITAVTGLAQTENKTSFTTIATAPVDGESLDDYLSKLICTGCHNRCSLLTPRCGIGDRQASSAEAYYEKYNAENDESVTTSDTNSENSTVTNSYDETTSSKSNSSVEPSEEESEIEESNDSSDDKTGFIDIMSTMGMYIAGAYYIVGFIEKKKIL